MGEGALLLGTMRSRDHDVVLVRRTIDLGCWEFGMGRGRSVYEQPGTKVDGIASRPKEGFQVSKGEWKGGTNKELARGVKKGNCAIAYIVNLYMCI
jgi:hypothetical protein